MKILTIPVILLISTIGWGQPAHPNENEVKMLRKWKLVEYLALSEEQSVRFFPRMEEFENAIKDIRKEKRRFYEDIDDELNRGNDITTEELDEMLIKYRELEEKELQLKHDHISGLSDILTPTQVARYAIFEQKFRKKMKDNIQKRNREMRFRDRRQF